MIRLSDFMLGTKGFVLAGFFALTLLVACDGGNTAGTVSGSDTELKDSELAEMSDLLFSSYAEMLPCDDVIKDMTAYVKDEKKAYTCDGTVWTVDAALTDSIQKIRDKKNESTKGNSGNGKGVSAGSIYDAENNTLTDLRDGHVYKTVRIGAEIWMAENLKYAYPGRTKNMDSSSFCYHDSLEYCEKYGRFYTWSAAMDSAGIIPGNTASHCGNRDEGACNPNVDSYVFRGVCPEGWYLPNQSDWRALLNAAESNEASLRSANISNELKEACVELNTKNERNTSGCDSLGGSDKFGFGELPVGIVTGGDGYYGVHYFGLYTDYWSLGFSQSGAYYMSRNYIWHGGPDGADPYDGLPIRCVKDQRAPRCKTKNEDHCEYGTLTDDRDGQTYKTVKIGDQWWMAENLNYAYLGGTETMDSSSFCPIHVLYRDVGTEFWVMDGKVNVNPNCFKDVLDSDIACPLVSRDYCEKYGRLYLWSAAVDSAGIIPGNTAIKGDYYPSDLSGTLGALSGSRGVCPNGWHLPDSIEWEILRKATIGDDFDTLGVLRSTTGWEDYEKIDETHGSDAYGFSILPAVCGEHREMKYMGQFWSSSGYAIYNTHYTHTTYAPIFSSSLIFYEVKDIGSYLFSASVRCLKDK